MLSNNRNRNSGSKSGGKGLGSNRIGTMTPLGAVPKEKKTAKMSIPKPVNLPSMKKEHAGNDPTTQLVSGGGGMHGWSKSESNSGADSGANGQIPAMGSAGTSHTSLLATGSTWGGSNIPPSSEAGLGMMPDKMKIPSFGDRRLNPAEYPSLQSAQSKVPLPKPSDEDLDSQRWADDERQVMRMQYGSGGQREHHRTDHHYSNPRESHHDRHDAYHSHHHHHHHPGQNGEREPYGGAAGQEADSYPSRGGGGGGGGYDGGYGPRGGYSNYGQGAGYERAPYGDRPQYHHGGHGDHHGDRASGGGGYRREGPYRDRGYDRGPRQGPYERGPRQYGGYGRHSDHGGYRGGGGEDGVGRYDSRGPRGDRYDRDRDRDRVSHHEGSRHVGGVHFEGGGRGYERGQGHHYSEGRYDRAHGSHHHEDRYGGGYSPEGGRYGGGSGGGGSGGGGGHHHQEERYEREGRYNRGPPPEGYAGYEPPQRRGNYYTRHGEAEEESNRYNNAPQENDQNEAAPNVDSEREAFNAELERVAAEQERERNKQKEEKFSETVPEKMDAQAESERGEKAGVEGVAGGAGNKNDLATTGELRGAQEKYTESVRQAHEMYDIPSQWNQSSGGRASGEAMNLPQDYKLDEDKMDSIPSPPGLKGQGMLNPNHDSSSAFKYGMDYAQRMDPPMNMRRQEQQGGGFGGPFHQQQQQQNMPRGSKQQAPAFNVQRQVGGGDFFGSASSFPHSNEAVEAPQQRLKLTEVPRLLVRPPQPEEAEDDKPSERQKANPPRAEAQHAPSEKEKTRKNAHGRRGQQQKDSDSDWHQKQAQSHETSDGAKKGPNNNSNDPNESGKGRERGRGRRGDRERDNVSLKKRGAKDKKERGDRDNSSRKGKERENSRKSSNNRSKDATEHKKKTKGSESAQAKQDEGSSNANFSFSLPNDLTDEVVDYTNMRINSANQDFSAQQQQSQSFQQERKQIDPFENGMPPLLTDLSLGDSGSSLGFSSSTNYGNVFGGQQDQGGDQSQKTAPFGGFGGFGQLGSGFSFGQLGSGFSNSASNVGNVDWSVAGTGTGSNISDLSSSFMQPLGVNQGGQGGDQPPQQQQKMKGQAPNTSNKNNVDEAQLPDDLMNSKPQAANKGSSRGRSGRGRRGRGGRGRGGRGRGRGREGREKTPKE